MDADKQIDNPPAGAHSVRLLLGQLLTPLPFYLTRSFVARGSINWSVSSNESDVAIYGSEFHLWLGLSTGSVAGCLHKDEIWIDKL